MSTGSDDWRATLTVTKMNIVGECINNGGNGPNGEFNLAYTDVSGGLQDLYPGTDISKNGTASVYVDIFASLVGTGVTFLDSSNTPTSDLQSAKYVVTADGTFTRQEYVFRLLDAQSLLPTAYDVCPNGQNYTVELLGANYPSLRLDLWGLDPTNNTYSVLAASIEFTCTSFTENAATCTTSYTRVK